jgi:branched-chain amino acid transport system permease protein
LKFGFGHLFAIGMSIVALLALAAFFRYSRTGIAIRAAAENAERARLLGISVGNLSLVVWVIAGILGGLAVTLFATVQEQFGNQPAPPEVLLIALAAATLARMRSMPTAVVAAVLITIVRQAVEFSFEDQAALVFVGLFLVLAASLILAGVGKGSRSRRSEEGEASSWKATEEARPTPKEMMDVSGIRLARRMLIVIGLAAVLIYPWAVSSRQTNLAGYYAIVAIVLLSLTVLTGWAGQVSLGQFAFVAVGAVLGGGIGARTSFWVALLIVPLLTAAFAVVVGIPALRIPGLFLAVATYAMAFAVQVGLFEERYFGWILPERVDRPALFLFDFEDERSMYYLCVLGLVLSVLLVTGLRRSRPGRVLIGLRDNENNVRSFGIDPVRMKLAAFGISGFLCGFAGVLLAHHARGVVADDFAARLSLDVFLFAVVGGVGSILGVMLGAVFFALRELLAGQAIIQWLIGPIGILTILYAFPGGLASIALGFRDGVLRIVAQRRQMIVPALFADFDPEALERRLIPLSEPLGRSGLSALSVEQRYRADSELYGRRGRLEGVRSAGEKTAIGAASEGARSAEEAQAKGPVEGATTTGASG